MCAGSRYISWLPSFSVEVTHSHGFTGVPVAQQDRVQTSQLDNMTRQVSELFPNLPTQSIQDDLQITRSVELTIENILEERLTVPPVSCFGSWYQCVVLTVIMCRSI